MSSKSPLSILLVLLLSCASSSKIPINLNSEESDSASLSAALVSEVASPSPVSTVSSNGPVMLELSEFDDASIQGIETKITQLRENTTEIYIRVNSNGGSVFGMMNLIQFLEHDPVTCIVDFRAYSAAAFFTESPACKERWATKRSTMLWHEALVQQTEGNKHSLRDTADALEALTDSIVIGTAERMKMSEDEFKAKINNKVWIISYQDMIKYHAIDKIVDPSALPAITTFEKPRSFLDLLLGRK